jgi:tetratricopeptide (TPR) repeat protein
MNWRVLIFLAFAFCLRGSLFAATPESEALLQRGNAAFKKGDRSGAIELLTEAVRVDPSNHIAFLNRGRIRESEGRFEEAIPDFDKVINLVPNHAGAVQLRGASLLRLGQVEKALADFDRYLAISPNQARYHWQRGIALYLLGRYDDGQKQFEACHRADTNDIEHVLWHFACTARKSGLKEARASFLPAGNDRRPGLRELYSFYAGKADTNALFAALKSEKQFEPEAKLLPVWTHFYVGLFLESTGEPQLAREHIAAAAQNARPGDFIGAIARSWRKEPFSK